MKLRKLDVEGIEAALRTIPKDWTSGDISWPGRDEGQWIAEARVELHHIFSSGGGPNVIGYGPTIAQAIRDAVRLIEEREKRDRQPYDDGSAQ